MKKCFTLISAVAMFIILTGCHVKEEAEQIQIMDSSDEELPNHLNEIIEFSDVIVKGSFTEFVKPTNMIRSANDPTVESDELYTEGQIYTFQIEKTYKGEVEVSIKTAITYADQMAAIDDQGERIEEVMVESLDYEELDLNKNYILFLVDSGFIEEGLYTPASGAYIIEIENDESIRFLSKRMEGQLAENLEVEEGDGSVHGILKTEYQNETALTIVEEFDIFPNFLAEEGIETLSDIEEMSGK